MSEDYFLPWKNSTSFIPSLQDIYDAKDKFWQGYEDIDDD